MTCTASTRPVRMARRPLAGSPAVEAVAEGADDAVALELLHRVAEVGFVGPCVLPDVKLKQVNGVGTEVPADFVGIAEDVCGGEDLGVGIRRQRWPLEVAWRDFRGGVEAAAGVVF